MSPPKAKGDPYIASQIKRLSELAKVIEEDINLHLARGQKPQITLKVRPILRPKDPNPWKGKSKIPRVLTSMLLSGIGVSKMTAQERTAVMLPAAIQRASDGERTIETGKVTVNWSKELQHYDVTACHKLLIAEGYKPSSQDKSLSKFVKLIQAGKPQEGPKDAISITWGVGIHAVTFYSQADMLYRSERVRVQWRNKNKAAGLVGATAEVYRGRQRVGGLWKFLNESVGRDQYDEIRDTARQAEGRLQEERLIAAQQAKKKAEAAKLEAALDDSFLFKTENMDSFDLPRRSPDYEYNQYDDGGEGGE